MLMEQNEKGRDTIWSVVMARNGSDNSTDPSDRYFLPDKAFYCKPTGRNLE